MDNTDKTIITNQLALSVGASVADLAKRNNIEGEVFVRATKRQPTCYVDDNGATHYGDVVLVDVDMVSDDDVDNEDDY